jgi:hypothetical protein
MAMGTARLLDVGHCRPAVWLADKLPGRRAKIGLSFVPGASPFEELMHGVNRVMFVAGGYGPGVE